MNAIRVISSLISPFGWEIILTACAGAIALGAIMGVI